MATMIDKRMLCIIVWTWIGCQSLPMGHHQHNLKQVSQSRQLSPRLEDKRANWHEYLAPAGRVDEVLSLRRGNEGHENVWTSDSRNDYTFSSRRDMSSYDAQGISTNQQQSVPTSNRRKRHNVQGNSSSRKLTQQDKSDMRWSIRRDKELLSNDGLQKEFPELEMKKAQNSFLCNFTIERDACENQILCEFMHMMCNHAGSRCQGTSPYYCRQMYKDIDGFQHNVSVLLRHYVDCVRALGNPLLTESPLPIHD